MAVRAKRTVAQCPRDPRYGKDIPGLRHGGWLDPKGELVRPLSTSVFRRALQRIHPACDLAFDRAMGWYAIVLWGREALALAEVDGQQLGFLKNVPATILTIKQHVRYTMDHGWHDAYLFMPPHESVLSVVSEIPEQFMRFEQAELISKYLTEVGEKRWRAAKDARHKKVEELVEDVSTVMDTEGNLRPSFVVAKDFQETGT